VTRPWMNVTEGRDRLRVRAEAVKHSAKCRPPVALALRRRSCREGHRRGDMLSHAGTGAVMRAGRGSSSHDTDPTGPRLMADVAGGGMSVWGPSQSGRFPTQQAPDPEVTQGRGTRRRRRIDGRTIFVHPSACGSACVFMGARRAPSSTSRVETSSRSRAPTLAQVRSACAHVTST
jgi:hypothetical protein